MSRCVLFGHNWQTMNGAGQYRGAEFLVCQDCGKTEPLTEDRTMRAPLNSRRDTDEP